MGRGIYSIPVALRILIVSSLFWFSIVALGVPDGHGSAVPLQANSLRGAAERAGANDNASAVDLNGAAVDPLRASGEKIVVLVFVRVDCPISNRYAPTIQEIERRVKLENAGRVAFWLVYPDRSESAEQIRRH